jgi:SAM-dependent methyltransferase
VGQAAAEAVPFESGVFDLVVILDVLEHCADDGRVLAEARRVLAAGGLLAVTVPAFPFLWSQNDVLNRHERRYRASELGAKLAGHGFRPLRLSYTNFFIFPAAAGLILLRRGHSEPELASPHFDADAYQVEMEPAGPLVNKVLTAAGRLEVALLRRINLPFGTGLIAIAERL